MRSALVVLLVGLSVSARAGDSSRVEVIASAGSRIDQIFRTKGERERIPGMTWGVVLDGKLVHSGVYGYAELADREPVTPSTRFRIASMTKSFTALAILKLRDQGKLSLEDQAERHLPEMARWPKPTLDTPAITLRNLLTMTAGMPEDNPWGDRQLGMPEEELIELMGSAPSFSTAPGSEFEYSNLGYALLGLVISRVSGMPYQRYIDRELLQPLGMTNTFWDYSKVRGNELASGYSLEGDGWRREPLLEDGAFGAMGGLITTLGDFAKYVAFHLAAWPPRDDPDAGPVWRASLREMHRSGHLSEPIDDPAALPGSPVAKTYGFGLHSLVDGDGVVQLGHNGGLPGFGSNFRFVPDYGLGVFSFANLTYTEMSRPNAEVIAMLTGDGGLQKRETRASPILEKRAAQLLKLMSSWEVELGESILADNFFLDRSREQWMTLSKGLFDEAGRVVSIGRLEPRNLLRGSISLEAERGRLDVAFTLTPQADPRIQEVTMAFVPGR
jgi:CubicO group peptidase (beta-lactamase class C family)